MILSPNVIHRPSALRLKGKKNPTTQSREGKTKPYKEKKPYSFSDSLCWSTALRRSLSIESNRVQFLIASLLYFSLYSSLNLAKILSTVIQSLSFGFIFLKVIWCFFQKKKKKLSDTVFFSGAFWWYDPCDEKFSDQKMCVKHTWIFGAPF